MEQPQSELDEGEFRRALGALPLAAPEAGLLDALLKLTAPATAPADGPAPASGAAAPAADITTMAIDDLVRAALAANSN